MYFAGKGMKQILQKRHKVMKNNTKTYVMQVILKNCGFVRLPVFGIISGPHLECVQRLLFVLFCSNVFVQAVSSGRFWLKESNFGPGKWCQACFWKKLPSKSASSVQLKNFIFGPLLTGILHKKGWSANPKSKINLKLLTFQSSLREIRGICTFCCQD